MLVNQSLHRDKDDDNSNSLIPLEIPKIYFSDGAMQ